MSLRSRLILTHVLVILLTLIIVAVGLVYILRDYQRTVQFARLGDAVVPLSFEARDMLANQVPPRQVLTRLEQEVTGVGHVMIITDKGLVIADAANDLTNRTVTLNRTPQREYFWGAHTIRTKTGDRVLLYAALAAGQVNGQNVYIALASFERPIGAALQDILPSLLIAGIIALVVSLLTALFLARSIAKPITQLTQATESFAAGHYDFRVRDPGKDELGRLSNSFNTMADQVQHARQMEKDFLANVSHELKTPLTSIQGFSQAILDGAVTDMQGAHRAAQTIFDETARMARLVGGLLTLARLESGETPLAPQPLDLAQLVPCWVDRLQPNAQAQGVALTCVVEPVPSIAGDAAQLEQVILNLVDNALKYNHPGGSVTVTTRAQTVESAAKSSVLPLRRAAPTVSQSWVTVAVADTGAGIPRNDLPRLFERFYRGDKARVAGGTGLGLAIAQEIVAKHHGKITVTSELGKGSTFTVHLPAKM